MLYLTLNPIDTIYKSTIIFFLQINIRHFPFNIQHRFNFSPNHALIKKTQKLP